MSIPKYDEIIPKALDFLVDGEVHAWRTLEVPLAEQFNLSADDITEEYASGNGTVFLDRISWALSYLTMAQLLERPKRGHYQITEAGRHYVGKAQAVQSFVKDTIAERERPKRDKAAAEAPVVTASHATPLEALDGAYKDIRYSTYETILDTVLSKSPYEFEKLVVKLLERMGYGGQVKNAGQVTQASNDGGIDGIIKEDVLGLGKIHIQAKRYARDNTIGREEIQKFVGALAVAQSNKGVFITTSRYTSGAREYASNLNGSTNLVLIDGLQLAEYIYDYGIGMQVERVIEIRKMDADFWDEMQDAK